MHYGESKVAYPDLQTALVVRDELIRRYGKPMLAYKCLGGCMKWHLTTQWKSGEKIRRWNNLTTERKRREYWTMVINAGIETIEVTGEML